MAQLVLGAVGATVGFFVGGPTGAQIGFALGSAAGASLTTQKVQGPRLSDLKAPQSSYGSVLPYIEGTVRTAGLWAWNSEKHETKTTRRQGGKGGPSVKTTTYTYDIDVLILLSENRLAGLRKVWANGKLIYSIADDASANTIEASTKTDAWKRITFYSGAPDQLPDPTYEAAVGSGNAPAYRGRGSVFIEGLNLGNSGQIPVLTFEVFSEGTSGGTTIHEEDFDQFSTVAGAGYALKTGDYSRVGIASISIGGKGFACFGIQKTTSADTLIKELSASILVTELDFDFYIGSAENDDAGIFSLISGGFASPVVQFSFNPRREVNFDSQQRPVMTLGSTAALGTSALPIGVWYHMKIRFASGANATTWEIRKVASGALVLSGTRTASPITVNGIRFYVDQNGSNTVASASTFANIRFGNVARATPTAVPLADAVARQCQRGTLQASEYDVSALTGTLRGFALSQIGPPRSAIEMLGLAYQFDAFESGGKINFRPRAQSSVTTIAYDDLGATDGERVEPLPLSRPNEIELPSQIVIKYSNVLNDYQDGTESSDRLTTQLTTVETTELSLVLTPTEARRIAEIRANDIQNSTLNVQGLSLDRSFARLEPCDAITVTDDDGATFRLRALRISDSALVRKIDAALDDQSAMTGVSATDENYIESSAIVAKVGTRLELMDIPLLRDVDDGLIHYIAVAKTDNTGAWPGAEVFRGQNDQFYESIASLEDQTYLGQTVNALGAFAGGTVFDEVNVLSVTGVGELESWTRDDVLAGAARPLLVGAEIIYYRQATPGGEPGAYTLRGLLRGRRGTEWAISGHTADERVVLLDFPGMRRIVNSQAQLGVEFDFKAVTFDSNLDAIARQAFTNTGVARKPFAPVDLRATRAGDNGLVLTWKRRTRLATRFTGAAGINVPLGENSESYEVDIMDGNTVKRTLMSATPTVTYTAAQQQADFGSVQESVAVRVYQVSADVGRGYVLAATATAAVV
jgi:hypothetical protein